MTFDDILAPLGTTAFLCDHLGKAPLHLEGDADKFDRVMNWSILDRLLEASTIWSTASLVLMLDKEPVPAGDYATLAPGRDGGQVLRPDPARVRRLLAQGATLVANDIDQLTPELAAFCGAMEKVLGGKVQANLYLSSKRRQGFKVHFDTHDVFAVHVEKVWHVFEGRADAPIAHPMFKNLPQSHHDEAKGALWREVRLTRGDLLYLPRGQYHYALAEDGGCVHIAFGVTYPIGMDVMSWLFERMIAEPLGRRNLPQGDPEALSAHLESIGARIAALLAEPAAARAIEGFMGDFAYARERYGLPDLLDPARLTYGVHAGSVQLVEQGGRCGLVRKGERRAVEVPRETRDLVAWVLARKSFSRGDFDAAFDAVPQAARERFLEDMRRMGLLAPD